MRARKKKWTQSELDTNERIIKNPQDFKGKWKHYFGNDNPIHLEIGCGKGRFITEMSRKNQCVNYIAVEREEHVIVSGARKAKESALPVAFILGDVTDLGEYFEQSEIARLYINFCDPWPNKKKWAKRRLTHGRFLDLYRAILIENGEIFFKTDNQQLFEFSLNQFCEKTWRLSHITFDLHHSDFEDNVMTEYEEKFSALGQPIYRCEATPWPYH